MAQHWHLPDEDFFKYTGKDWLLLLLDRVSKELRCLILLVMWRAWTVHNNITHCSGDTSVSSSIGFLLSYQESLESQYPAPPADSKGKQEVQKVGRAEARARRPDQIACRWEPPQTGWTKINVDGSYQEQSGAAGVGVIARDSNGVVIFTAWRFYEKCASAPEVEALACIEGLRWAHRWGFTQLNLETDCARIKSALTSSALDRSEVGPIIEEVRGWIRLMRECNISQVKRDGNNVANALALYARKCKHSAAWLGQAPTCALNSIKADCNFSISS